MELQFGVCKFCGQIGSTNIKPDSTQDQIDQGVMNICKCDDAQKEVKKLYQIELAKDRIDELFGEHAEALGFHPITDTDVLDVLKTTVELLANKKIRAMGLVIRGAVKAKISQNIKGTIIVERSEVSSQKLEVEEV